ncbi:MAG: hypothetical protein IJ416_07095 [Ruminiclostridium sp.]|nr:hypothetical protein [Ruminiclostridium sp.]
MKKRKSVIVELTSLLDVIFIMLFMVMNRSQNAAAQAQNTAAQEIAAAQSQVQTMQEEVDGYREIMDEVEAEREKLQTMNSKLNSYEVFDEYATIVSVFVIDNTYKRTIKVDNSVEAVNIDFDWDNMDYAGKSLEEALNSCINDSVNPVFIVFSYNGDKLYRQDYNLVSETMTSVQGGYENVYIKFDDTSV